MRVLRNSMALATMVITFLAVIPTFNPASAEQHTIKIGDKAPDFKLPNAHGKERTLYDLLESGPVILTFYRGGWCPYCNDQLYDFQQNLEKFKAHGAQLVAVSPEQPKSMVDTVLKNSLTFEVLSDLGNRVARNYDLIWVVPKNKRAGFERWLKGTTGMTLAELNGVDSNELPIPATFVIAQNGEVTYMFKDENYKKRAKQKDILSALNDLNAE
ncbi:MAG: peroxiredoxin-like family protein [Alphaproteobacteria bacterium]